MGSGFLIEACSIGADDCTGVSSGEEGRIFASQSSESSSAKKLSDIEKNKKG